MATTTQHLNLHELPRDPFAHAMDFLTGWELLALGCVSKSMQREVDRDHCIWRKRLLNNHAKSSNDSSISWKRKYTNTQSLRLRGGDRNSAISLPSDLAAKWQSEPFSIDLWFCLLPRSETEPNAYTGGVLLGAQSPVPTEEEAPNGVSRPQYHQQLIHVDASGNLYCSVTTNKSIVKATLQFERWYHIALTYNHGLQCVFLDGALLQVVQEPLHVEWGKMKELQFGSGFMTFGSKGRPHENFVGWYGFHGLLDAHRVWSHALSMGDVQRLARGERVSSAAVPAWPTPTTDAPVTHDRVYCPRPLERHCMNASLHAT